MPWVAERWAKSQGCLQGRGEPSDRASRPNSFLRMQGVSAFGVTEIAAAAAAASLRPTVFGRAAGNVEEKKGWMEEKEARNGGNSYGVAGGWNRRSRQERFLGGRWF